MGDKLKFQEALKNFDRMAVSAGKRRWIEKTPKHIYRIGDILRLQPEAKIILIIRDGRDVACSFKYRTGSVEIGIKRWHEDNLAAKEYWSHPNVYAIRYEQLVDDFENSIADVLSFLNETYEKGMKDYYKTKTRWYSTKITKPPSAFGEHHNQYRNWQINQPLFDGRGRWKELSVDELSYIEEVAGSMLVEFGYTKMNNETSNEIV